jgi:hypothetical protein
LGDVIVLSRAGRAAADGAWSEHEGSLRAACALLADGPHARAVSMTVAGPADEGDLERLVASVASEFGLRADVVSFTGRSTIRLSR